MTALLHASLTQRSKAVSLGMGHGWTEAKLENQQQAQQGQKIFTIIQANID
jgi:hypothetical protein